MYSYNFFMLDIDKDRIYNILKYQENRKNTFYLPYAPWPMKVDPEKLAEAGFFYTTIGDRVQCIFCQQRLFQWEEEDNPEKDHLRDNPSCFFQRMKEPWKVKKQPSSDYMLCKICMENKIDRVFVPCGHTICALCACIIFFQSEKCAFCNQYVFMYSNFYIQ
jgi:hypothetical protein